MTIVILKLTQSTNNSEMKSLTNFKHNHVLNTNTFPHINCAELIRNYFMKVGFYPIFRYPHSLMFKTWSYFTLSRENAYGATVKLILRVDSENCA